MTNRIRRSALEGASESDFAVVVSVHAKDLRDYWDHTSAISAGDDFLKPYPRPWSLPVVSAAINQVTLQPDYVIIDSRREFAMKMLTRLALGCALALIPTIAIPGTAAAQSGCSAIVTGAVLTAGQWNNCFIAKQDFLGFTPLNPSSLVGTTPISVTAGAGVVTISLSTGTTGTGNVVLANTPTLITPVLGSATATSITAPLIVGGTAVGSTLTLQSTSNGSPSGDSIIVKTGGAGTYSAAGNFTGGTSSSLFSVRGTNASPVTDSFANVVLQSFGNQTTGGGTTFYSSWVKKTTTTGIGGRPIWGEAFDTVGGTGSYAEGARFNATLNGGTLGNGIGVVGLGVSTVAYSYIGGAEFQVFNLSGTPATTTFSSSKFAWGVMATCGQGAGAACDAGFITNPFSNSPFISGILVPSGTVSDTAFRNDASLVYGVDLDRGTYSGAAVVGSSMIGGKVAASNLTFKSTSGAGTTDFIDLLVGNNGSRGIRINTTSHTRWTATAPALTSCGTSPAITGNDVHGTVTMGTATPTGCVITFAIAYATAPTCRVTWRTNIASMQYTVSTSAITLTQTGTSSNLIDYDCWGT